MKNVKILGAGISGLTAAINLAKEGYNVEVHEKFSDVGKKHKLNFEGLENWRTDIMKLLKTINIKINFKKKCFKSATWYSPSFKKATLKSKSPLCYLVERGDKNSLEYSLKRQALERDVRFKFNSKIKHADIISTGSRRPMGVGFGTFYENVDYKNKVIGILSEKIAPKGYFYILIWDNKASICTTTSNLYGTVKANYIEKMHKNNLNLDICKKILKGSKEKHSFSGFANFKIPKTSVIDGKIYTGEAAGFQDAFLGFGMKYAFLSGYFAAKSIIENISYDELWKNSFLKELKASLNRRFFLNLFGDRIYEKIVTSYLNGQYKSKVLKAYYSNYNWNVELLYQILRIIMRW